MELNNQKIFEEVKEIRKQQDDLFISKPNFRAHLDEIVKKTEEYEKQNTKQSVSESFTHPSGSNFELGKSSSSSSSTDKWSNVPEDEEDEE